MTMTDQSALWNAGKSSATPMMDERSLLVPIGVLMILTLQFQTLPIEIPISALPVTTVVALLVLPFVTWKFRLTPLLLAIILFFCFALLQSAATLFIDLLSGYPDTRFIGWARQLLALFAGVATFLVFRATLIYFPLDKISRLILIGSLPALLLSVVNILWGAFNLPWARMAVTSVREAVRPMAYVSPVRATGFATEPSTLATIIAILLVPALLICFLRRQNLLLAFFVSALAIPVFVWTFSLSGLFLLLSIFLAGAFLGPKRGKLLVLVSSFLVVFVGAFALFPGNMVLRHARALALGQENLSFTDRFYGVVGPFIRSTDSFTMLGYGLGGVSAHFDDVVPSGVKKEILESKWKEYPTISSIFGRTFAETGAVGLVLFLIIIWLSFWQLSRVLKGSSDDHSGLAYKAVRLALIAAYASMFVSVGPYHTPYFWFWIAVVDALYILKTKEKMQNVRFPQ
jgi:hypothetical protein